jgi:hypothetical protein
MFSSLATPHSSFLHLLVSKLFFMRFVKKMEMEENEHQLIQHELEVHEVMRVHREERVFPSIYSYSEFMRAAGILQDFQTLISNAGLETLPICKTNYVYGAYFRFSWSLPNPMVHY